MEVETSVADISQMSLLASDDEDIFASIDLSAISDPFPKLIHLDCNRDTSNYNDWVADKCFTNIFPFDETCLYDPGLLSDLFLLSRQLIAELKLLGQDDREKRLSVTNLLHFVYNELSDLEVDKDLQMIQSLLENKKFLPSAQDGKHYIHGYFEWRLLLALIAVKKGGAVSHLKDLSIELVAYSVARTGDSDLKNISAFPCKCFESLWSVVLAMTQKLSNDLNIWTLLDVSFQEFDNSSSNALRLKRRKYTDSSLLHLWFLRYFPACFMKGEDENESLSLEYREVVSRSFLTFLEKEPPEADLRVALYNLKSISKSHQLNVDTLIQLWEQMYRRINTNFKTINLDSANSLLVPNDTAVSYINKIRAIVEHTDEDNPNLTSYDLFLGLWIRGWQRAGQEADVKYQQKFSNRVLLKFSAKMWLPLNEMGIHNLINLLLALYYLADDRSLDRIENILLSVPFAEITHNRRVAVFKGLAALLIMFYGKRERPNKSYPENFLKKFENSVGVDRFTGRQLICAMDTICSASERMDNKEFAIIHPWIKLYLNTCTDNDRDLLLDTLTRIMEKYIRLKATNLITEDGEEVIRRIHQNTQGIVVNYLNAEQEIEVTSFVANLMICLKEPIQGVPLVDTLFTNMILNNIRTPRLQLKIVNKLAELPKEGSVIHVNNLIKALIKFLLVIDGPVMDLQPLFCLINESKEFQSFCTMDGDEFLGSPQPFAVLLKGIRAAYENLNSDPDRDRFHSRFEMFFQMYTKWCLPHMKTAEEAYKTISNTTAMIYICGKVMYSKKTPNNPLKTLINDFYLTSSLLGKKAQPPVVVKAMVKVMHSLLGGLFQLETHADEYLNSVISDLIFHWTPQFLTEYNVNGAVLPFLKFTRANLNTHLPGLLFERLCQVMLTNQLQRDILALKLLREILGQSKADSRVVKIWLNGCLLRLLEYYCKCEDFAPVKKSILDLLDDLSAMSCLKENAEMSRVLDEVFEKWTMAMLHSPNYFELAIKLARLFPVNLRMIMPKLRVEITARNHHQMPNFATERLNQKMRNLEMILQQK